MVMRVIFSTVALVLLVLLGDTGASQAQTYPWCATYNDKYGSHNCGFVTFEQCLATVRGIGGFCGQNPWFQPSVVDPRRRTKPRRHRG
jgi:hypothetical protein